MTRTLAALRARAAQDAGVIAVVTALVAVVLFVLAAMAVDVGRWYSEGQRLQAAVDAAALAGAPYLPDDLAGARTAARELITANGYDPGAVPDSAITFGAKPTQLRVTMDATIENAFGTVVGSRFKSVTRTAVAEFTPPASMGSPCNVLGLNPPDPDGGSVANPDCGTSTFWNNIGGPDAGKWTGDRFASRRCAVGNSVCSGTRNLDYFGGDGVFGQPYYVYRIRASAPVSALTVQVFDPMFVDVGLYCQSNLAPSRSGEWGVSGVEDQDSPNPFVTDAVSRYSWGMARGSDAALGQVRSPGPRWSPDYCTGDVLWGGDAEDFTTSFLVLNPTDSQDPLAATPTSCSAGANPRSFGGYSGPLTKALVATDPDYDEQVASTFRQWVDLCRISTPQVGEDYYLLVRSNVRAGAGAARMLDPSEDPSVGGDGENRYGLRVTVAGGSPADVSVAAMERLPMFANVSSGSVGFPLVRVTSAQAGAQLTVTFFDGGDSSHPASVAITAPGGGAPSGCLAAGEVRTSPTGDFNTATCTLSNISAAGGFDGKLQRILVPIPEDYRCDDSDPQACWYRLSLRYTSGSVANDTLTWTATLDADRVRLVE